MNDAEKAALERRIDELCEENQRLRNLCADLYAEMLTYSKAPTYNASIWATRLGKLGIEAAADNGGGV